MGTRGALRELRRHRIPSWWSDAKLGIFVHWTPAAVPGWAPVDSEIGELLAAGDPEALAENPYTEWYQNSLRFPGSSVSRHHRETFGDAPYSEFVDAFREGLEQWDPDAWARRFAATGARYVVLVAKHHDGWCLWPSTVANPRRSGWYSDRDLVGELREAVLGQGMRFGLYYSGGLDWTFEPRAIGNLGDLVAAVPRGDYPAYAEAQVRELIGRYRPSVLWNDIAWPAPGKELWPLMQHYYDSVPDGVLNDRWMPWNPLMALARSGAVRRTMDRLNARATDAQGGLIPPRPPHFDVRTPEYATFDHVPADPWECVRGCDQSFGFNRNSRPEHFLDPGALVAMFVDIVAKGGNLLLNVGPRGEDASIPDQQLELLDALGSWTSGPGSTVFGSRPWVRPGCSTPSGRELRFWTRDRSTFVAIGPRPGADAAPGPGPAGPGSAEGIRIPGVAPTPTTEVLDDSGAAVPHERLEGGLRLVTRLGEGVRWPVFELRDCRPT